MSNYEHIVFDLPRRGMDFLNDYHPVAEMHGREVTLLLAVAALVLVTPSERLKLPDESPGNMRTNPPSPSGDFKTFGVAANKLETLYSQCFWGSILCPDAKAAAQWSSGVVTDPVGPADDWNWVEAPLLQNSKKAQGKKCKSVVGQLRNALGHGNLFTRAVDGRISKLVFLSHAVNSKTPNTWNVLTVSPAGFHAFLTAWCSFLSGLAPSLPVPAPAVSIGRDPATDVGDAITPPVSVHATE